MNMHILTGGPYRQTDKKDLWFPVKAAAVRVLVQSLPLFAVTALAILVGRGFGPALLGIATLAELYNLGYLNKDRAAPAPVDRIKTNLAWGLGLLFTALWLLNAWPVNFLKYKLFWEGAPVIRWSFYGHPWRVMGPWLYARVALIIAIPFTLPETWQALSWAILVEIIAPSWRDSIVAPRQAAAPPQTAMPRETSALIAGATEQELF